MKIAGTYSFCSDQHTLCNVLMNSGTGATALPGVDRFVLVEGETKPGKPPQMSGQYHRFYKEENTE